MLRSCMVSAVLLPLACESQNVLYGFGVSAATSEAARCMGGIMQGANSCDPRSTIFL
jgi:hypothetical protein